MTGQAFDGAKFDPEANAPSPYGRTLLIEFVDRTTGAGDTETLEFQPGVNLLVGPPNSGKSKWLHFIDYLLGDRGTAEDALGSDLAEKYRSARVGISVCYPRRAETGSAGSHAVAWSCRSHIIERRWKEAGLKTKILIDDEPKDADEFNAFILGELVIPLLHYPQGNPYAPRTWPVLSWRTLYRHVYRHDRSWGDVAEKQPEGDQLASLLQFLGLAASLFSPDFGEAVRLRNEVSTLRAQRDAFYRTLTQVTKELAGFNEMSVSVTADSIGLARKHLVEARDDLQANRIEVLEGLRRDLPDQIGSNGDLSRMPDRTLADLAAARAEFGRLAGEQQRVEARVRDLSEYLASIRAERARLERARVAGETFAPLRVTACPVCDRPVKAHSGDTDCYLCGREGGPDLEHNFGVARLNFELEQLANEERELVEVVARTRVSQEAVEAQGAEAQRKVMSLEDLARPLQVAAAAILPPRLAALDQETGAIDERLRTLEGIARSLQLRDSAILEIDRLDARAAQLEAAVDLMMVEVPFEKAAAWLEDGFNAYFNRLNEDDPTRWPKPAIAVKLSARAVALKIGDKPWRANLGATLTCFFLNAYHYALLSLTDRPGCHYPGLTVVDFPPTLADTHVLTDEENYLVEPFIGLTKKMEPIPSQVIVAGRSFEHLDGANLIELTEVFK